MEKVKLRLKKLSENAVLPSYAHDNDAGMDVTAASKTYDKNGNVVYGLGFAAEIVDNDDAYVLIRPRSSVAKKNLVLANSEAVIDYGYRGEILLKFKKTAAEETSEYEVGDKIGQMFIEHRPKIVIEEVDELSDTERGTGGFGSTGK